MQSLKRWLNSANGWKRIWLVLAILGFIGVVACAAISFPTLERQEANLHASYARLNGEAAEQSSSRQAECLSLLKGENASALPLCSRLAMESHPLVNKSLAEQERYAWEVLQKNYQESQITWLAKVLGLWAGSVALLYAVGLLFGWVRRGFKPDA